MDHPPYSPDLTPCDFWLFPKLKTALKGQTFADLSDIQRNVKPLLRGIPETDFSRLFPVVAPSSHEVDSFTSRVFLRRQQPLVHMSANFAFTGPFRELNCRTMYMFIHEFHCHVQNATTPCRSQELLPFISVS
jgi:hypothetical protein